MIYLTEHLTPFNVLRHFEDIASIPHGSGNEAALARHIVELAKANSLEWYLDDSDNVLVRVPASTGMEDRPPLLLQAHSDMVCVHRPELDIDMDKTPIELVLEENTPNGNILHANGTSLGADNAVGMCFMMALMEDRTVVHGPLELLFTTEEEVGCKGVQKFDTSLLRSRRMITMDCGGPSSVCLGSAGVAKFDISRDMPLTDFDGTAIKITIGGLIGGHTSGSMSADRGSAVDFMGRILSALCDEFEVRLVSANMPGSFAGSMPVYIDFTVGIASENDRRAVEIISKHYEDFREEVIKREPEFSIDIETANADKAASASDTRALADLIMLSPYGVHHRDPSILSRTRASSLIAILEYIDGKFSGVFSIRANIDPYLDCLTAKMQTACRVCGFELTRISRSYAWYEKPESQFREICQTVYGRIHNGERMSESVIHGGLEAGFISHAIPDMDIVGFAPHSSGAHTVEERLYVDSMQPMWEFLQAVMKELCEI